MARKTDSQRESAMRQGASNLVLCDNLRGGRWEEGVPVHSQLVFGRNQHNTEVTTLQSKTDFKKVTMENRGTPDPSVERWRGGRGAAKDALSQELVPNREGISSPETENTTLGRLW